MDIEKVKKDCFIANQEKGTDNYYDCPKCLNKGHIFVVNEEYLTLDVIVCDCMVHRRNKRYIEKQGLTNLFETYTFNNFFTDEEWQGKLKTRAWEYASEPKGWLFIGGQIGSGKTLAGISILNELMNRGYNCMFVSWQQLMQELKTHINEQEYFDLLERYSKVDVLYLDDLFKGGYLNTPTDSDVRLTQILIDSRYIKNKTTIISSEMLKEEILNISESIGSRIFEKAKGNILQISKDKERNFRLK